MSVLDNLVACKTALLSVHNSISNAKQNLAFLETDLALLDTKSVSIIQAQQYYKHAIDIVYERSIQELKDVLNSALNYIFNDRDYLIDIILTDKRGKALKFVILDGGKEVNLRRGMGMGVKCVISAILHIYYLQCKNSPILLLDEAYSNISEEYIDNFFEFITKLCDKLDFIIVLITHDKRFIPYAQRLYRISKGRVSLEVQ